MRRKCKNVDMWVPLVIVSSFFSVSSNQKQDRDGSHSLQPNKKWNNHPIPQNKDNIVSLHFLSQPKSTLGSMDKVLFWVVLCLVCNNLNFTHLRTQTFLIPRSLLFQDAFSLDYCLISWQPRAYIVPKASYDWEKIFFLAWITVVVHLFEWCYATLGCVWFPALAYIQPCEVQFICT